MLHKRPILAFIAAWMLGACFGASALAADLTIASTMKDPPTVPSSAGKMQSPAKAGESRPASKERPAAKKGRLAKAEKAKRPDKDGHRKILTYKLFNDPDFKLRGAVTDKKHFGTANRMTGLGSGLGYSISGNPVSKAPNNALPGAAFKPEATDSAGIAFDCREKSVHASPVRRREFTACYKQELDRSWQAHTYVSRRRSEGSQNWGGGLSLGYAY